jgi:hypothetical protein
MSTDKDVRLDGAAEEKHIASETLDTRAADGSSLNGSDLLSFEDLDPALNMKMHLLNDVSAPCCTLLSRT